MSFLEHVDFYSHPIKDFYSRDLIRLLNYYFHKDNCSMSLKHSLQKLFQAHGFVHHDICLCEWASGLT